MKDHMARNHPDHLQEVLESVRMMLIKPCPSALTRQVREAIEISRGNQEPT